MAHRQDVSEAVHQALSQVETPENRRVLRHARRAEAVSMALAGLTYEQIGNELSITPDGAKELVGRTLEETRNYAVDGLRSLENARLDRAQAAIWGKVIEGDLKAISTYLRISERRARLNGLDAPSKIAMAVSVRNEMERALLALEEVVLEAEVVQASPSEDVVTEEERQAVSHRYIIDPSVDE